MSAWSRWPMQPGCWCQKIPGATRRSLRECRVGGLFRRATSNRTRHQRSARPRKVALETHSLRIELGRKSKVTNWKVFYRDDLISIKTGLPGVVKAKNPPLSGQESSLSGNALKYTELKGLTGES